MKKIVTFFILISLLGLIGCGGTAVEEVDDTPLDSQSDNTDSSVVEESASDSELGYPYPAGEQAEVESIDPKTITRPANEDFPKFPGKIAFHSSRIEGFEIFILDGASSELIRLDRGEALSTVEPSWDADCENVYVTLGNANNSFSLGNGAAVDQAVVEPFFAIDGILVWNPAPSPTGGVIAHQVNRDRRINICFVGPNGEDLGCMDRGGFSNSGPSWSADGTKLAFSTDRDNNAEIYVMDYPGGPINRVTESQYVSDRSPAISPNGSRIAFESLRGAGTDIFVVNLDGTNEIQITDDGADNKRPVWIGDDMLAYHSSSTGNLELFMTSVDNVDPVQLTYNLAEDAWPTWCPAS